MSEICGTRVVHSIQKVRLIDRHRRFTPIYGGGIIAVPLVIGAVLKLPAEHVVALVNAALLGSGVVTISQCKGVGPVGIRLPCMMGTSFAFVGAAISIGFEHGVAGILGCSLVASIVMIAGSCFMPHIRKLFPPRSAMRCAARWVWSTSRRSS